MEGRRRATVAAAVTVVSLLLVGCAEEQPQPRFEDVASASPPASVRPSASPSVAETASETPEEFIRRWAALETEVQNTGETEAYRALTRECRSCQAFADRVESYYAAGGYIRFEGERILGIERQGPPGSTTYRVTVRLRPTEYKESDESRVRRLGGGRSAYAVVLRRHEGAWSLRDISEYAS